MPELPEVETIKNSLRPVIGKRVVKVRELHPAVVKIREFPAGKLTGKLVRNIYRRGKYLVFVFAGGYHLVIHLGMSGRLYWSEPGEELAKHTHFILNIEGDKQLRYEDARRFGGIRFIRDLGKFFQTMGPEPLDEDFTLERLCSLLRNRRISIKSLLLNQQLVAGIGNIYADEILFRAGIHPARPAGELSGEESERLYTSIKEILAESIAHRGTTFRDYRDGKNQPGAFQDLLAVYAREGCPCVSCGHAVEKIVIGGRSSHYCPHCQK